MGARRLAIFIPSLRPGGAERMMVNLATELTCRGEDVELVVAEATADGWLETPGITVVHLDATRVLGALIPLMRYIERRKPKALLSTQEHANILAALAVTMSSHTPRLVLREPNTPSRNVNARARLRSRVIPAIARLAYRRADALIAVSEGVRDDMSQFLRLPVGRIATICNPVVTDEMLLLSREPVDHPWFASGGIPVILGVGSLREQKDFDTLISAFAVAREKQEMRLVILGEGELRNDLESRAADLGVESHVDLPGHVVNPYAYMARADLFVLSSRWEGSPNVLVEALVCGCRCIATDCPSGPREILREGNLGELVPVGHVDALAATLLRALDGPVHDPADVVQRYGASAVAGQYLTILDPEDRALAGTVTDG